MASITIRNLDDEVKSRLRIRAAGNGRSMEEEVRFPPGCGRTQAEFLKPREHHPRVLWAFQGGGSGVATTRCRREPPSLIEGAAMIILDTNSYPR